MHELYRQAYTDDHEWQGTDRQTYEETFIHTYVHTYARTDIIA